MSVNNLPDATASPDKGDAITLTFDDDSKIEMSKSFAKAIDSEFDFLSEQAGTGKSRYALGEEFYERVDNVVYDMNKASVDANRDNVRRLDSGAIDYFQDMAGLLTTQQGRAVENGEGDAGRIKYFVDGFRGAYDQYEASLKPPEETGGASGKAASAKDVDVSEVKEMLADVASSDNSSEKSNLLGRAIDALIAQIRGTAGKGGSDDPIQGKIDDVVDAIGGKGAKPKGGSEGKPTEASATAPRAPTDGSGEVEEPSRDASDGGGSSGGDGGGRDSGEAATPQPVSKTLSGDALMGRLDGGGGRLKLDSSDQGIGIGDDEIGGGERMIFRPEAAATGGSVDLVDLFGDEKGGQEVAKITVMKDGRAVDEILVRGDVDGDQTVKLDQPFDELVFEGGGGKNSDFAIKSITTETAAAETPDGPGAPGGPEAPGGAGEGDGAEFDLTQLLELLQALGDANALVNASKSLSEEDRERLLSKIEDVVSSIAEAIDAEGEGSSDVTGEEVATILEAVNGLNVGLEGGIADSPEKNDALDALASGVGKVADEMALEA